MMRRAGRGSDEGFSLVELMVASVVGMLVLAVAYLIFNAMYSGFKDVQDNTVESRGAAEAMAFMTRYIRGMQSPTSMSGNQMSFSVDVNNDGVLETVSYSVSSAGTLNETIVSTSTTKVRPLATYVKNNSSTSPLFTYYGSSGATVPAGVTTTQTAMVRVSITIQNTGTPAPAPYSTYTNVYIRNKLSGGG